jgi:hypothetical protein
MALRLHIPENMNRPTPASHASLPEPQPVYADGALSSSNVTSEWISSKLADIDRGAAEFMNRTCSQVTLGKAAHSAGELAYVVKKLGFPKAWKLATDLEHAFQHPFETVDSREQLLMDATSLRFELPGFTFLQCI